MHTAPIDPNKQQAPLEFFFHAISFLSPGLDRRKFQHDE
jgi:hypothetical protein